MFTLPPLPPWNGLHVLAVHLPIGALAAAPALLLLCLLFGRTHRGLVYAAFTLLAIGAGACVLATSTGEAAADIALPKGDGQKVLEHHEDTAELAHNVFLGLAGAYALVAVLAAGLKDKFNRRLWAVLHLVFLLAYAPAMLILANAAHLGGELVHRYGTLAHLAPAAPGDDGDDQ